jgi:NAD(P)-dependent dehydrogenase (short-subunit alcohol dehydrogenase family)
MTFEGKVAIVTGAATKIGKAIALRLGCESASVAVNYRDDPWPANAVDIVALLASDAARRITGQNIHVNGGAI